MTGTFFTSLIGLSLRAPAKAAQQVLSLGLRGAVLWQSFALVTICSVLLTTLMQGALPVLPTGDSGLVIMPWTYAMILGGSLLLLSAALLGTGKAMRGSGRFHEALALVVWLEVLAMALRLLQGLLLLVLPPLAGLVGLLGLGYLFWSLVHFINALHDFESLGKSALVLVLALLGIGITVAVLLALFGVGAQGGLPNV